MSLCLYKQPKLCSFESREKNLNQREKNHNMRQINGYLINEPYQIHHPFRMLISGSSGTGKTSFCENLIESNLIKRFKTIYYIYPEELDYAPGMTSSPT